MGMTLALGLILPKLMMGDVCRAFAGPVLMTPTWAPGAIMTLIGASLALCLASPTEGGLAEVVLVGSVAW